MLSDENLRTLQKGEWLNTELVNAGQSLLRKHFPKVCGLQDTMMSKTLSFVHIEGEFVQILHCNNNHSICATTIACKPNVVKIYDSMRAGDAAMEVKESVATIMKSQNRHILFEEQKDGSSFGLFALAFAFDICDGKDPPLREYSRDNFCSHFHTCLIQQEITSFPSSKITMAVKPPSILRRVKIFCHCRLPDSGDDMVKCS